MRLGAVLTYGVRKGVCKTDVSKAVDKPTLAKEEVVIATPEVVQELFADALANRRELIPFLTFTFFCGIRPEGEMSKLEWSNVLEDKVVLRGTQTKTGHKREIPLSENAKAWLSMYTGERTGKVVPSLHRINQLRKKNWKASSHKDKTQDVARHSFCSYYYQLVGDLTKAMDASGHEQPGVFYKHYREHVSAEACARYWAIFPAA